LGVVVLVALVIFVIVRRRNKRDAAEAEMHATRDGTLESPPSSEEQDRDHSTPGR
jgi:hypothetical protein